MAQTRTADLSTMQAAPTRTHPRHCTTDTHCLHFRHLQCTWAKEPMPSVELDAASQTSWLPRRRPFHPVKIRWISIVVWHDAAEHNFPLNVLALRLGCMKSTPRPCSMLHGRPEAIYRALHGVVTVQPPHEICGFGLHLGLRGVWGTTWQALAHGAHADE